MQPMRTATVKVFGIPDGQKDWKIINTFDLSHFDDAKELAEALAKVDWPGMQRLHVDITAVIRVIDDAD